MTAVITASTFREKIAPLCKQKGFALAGMVAVPGSPGNLEALAAFPQWIAENRQGDMAYLSRTAEGGQLLRAHVNTPLPWARSVLMLGCNYRTDTPGSLDPYPDGSGWIARYAITGTALRGSDYHDVLLARCRELEADLHAALGPSLGEFHARSFVDTGPFVERALATHAGLGWQAKNTCLIHPEIGSWFFLASIALSLEYADDGAPRAYLPEGQCGTCTRCIEACPTGALDQPYWMDASRCIAYLTIEKRGSIPEELREGVGRQIFGCDICQDVCPWNTRAARRGVFSADPAMQPREALINPSLLEIAQMTGEQVGALLRRSPMRRTKRAGLLRNVAIAMGNDGREIYREALERWSAQTEDAVLAEAARWALQRPGAAKKLDLSPPEAEVQS